MFKILMFLLLLTINAHAEGTWLLNNNQSPIYTHGNSPSMFTCGSSPTVGQNSNPTSGLLLMGGGTVASCYVNFASPGYTTTPICQVQDETTAQVSKVSTTPGAMLISVATNMGTDTIAYECFGTN